MNGNTALIYENALDKTLAPHTQAALAKRIKADIDAKSVELYRQLEQRKHLGASVVGDECARKIWYGFRWFKREEFEARMLRLFQRGHDEEAKLIGWLRAIGFAVYDVATDTNEQFRIKACEGHFGGSLDGVGVVPYEAIHGLAMLLEFKTHNTKSFVSLKRDGVKKFKPKHFSQMCLYGRDYGFRYALYLAVNKNDDDIHVEIVQLDWRHGQDLQSKSEDIIRARTAPPRIAENPAYIDCKFCHLQQICFYGASAEKNCRSCVKSVPVADGQWYCEHWKSNIPPDFIERGCDQWQQLPQ